MIVHIIYNDSKFVDNYISFFNTNFSDLEFYYVLYGRGRNGDLDKYKNNNNVIVINKLYSFSKMMEVKRLMRRANKIVFSGIFGIEYFLYLILNRSIWDKIYLHFWGGDFYQFRDSSLNKTIMKNAIEKCKCLLFAEHDYNVLAKLFNIEKEYKSVFAPCYDYNTEKYKPFRSLKKEKKSIKILLGNSASSENQHIEAINMLTKFKNEDIIIYCPLSYGDKKYAEKIINYGKKEFGDKFIPLVDYVDYNNYLEIVSSCNIAIYNHNRQQAFGTIMMSLALGLKVFLNEDNTLYYDYKDLGCDVYNINEISDKSFQEIIGYTDEKRESNYMSIDKLRYIVCKSWDFLRK